MEFAGPVALLGAWLLIWSWMGSHPDHVITGAFYRRFRPRIARPPARPVRTMVIALGAGEVVLALLLAIWRPEPVTGVVISLGSAIAIGFTVLVASIRSPT